MADLFLQQFEDDLTKAFTDTLEENGWTGKFKAKLGNGEGVVIVPPSEAKFPGALWVYRELQAGRKDRVQVANTYAGIPYNNDWPEVDVVVGYPPGERQILEIMKVDRRGLVLTKGLLPIQSDNEIQKYLSPERWTPLRITAGTGLGLNLIGGWLQSNTSLIYLPNTTSILDMTSHRPSTSNMARYCMVYYDPDSDTFGAVDGDDFDNAEQVEIETFMPTAVPAGAMVLGHTRLHQGQTGWGDSDIVRPALPFFTPPGIVPPSLGGGGFDLTTIQGFLFYNGLNTYQVHCVGDQTAAPTVNDDETSTPHPFGVLSLWVMSVTAGAAENAVYMCADPTDGAAVWLRLDGAGGGGGTVTSVNLAMPAIFSVSGVPITTSGVMSVTLNSQSGNVVFASPSGGGAGIPAFRALVAADIPNLAASIITSGQLALARGGSNADLSATGGTSQVVMQESAGAAFTVRALAAADIPNLAASKITSGQLALARGGTGADLSATGGSGYVVKQGSAGATFTVGAITSAEIATALAQPPTIGGTTPATGAFTFLQATNRLVVNGTATSGNNAASITAAVTNVTGVNISPAVTTNVDANLVDMVGSVTPTANLSGVYGVRFTATIAGSSSYNIFFLAGMSGQVGLGASYGGTITYAIAGYFGDVVKPGTGTISNQIGVYIPDQTKGTSKVGLQIDQTTGNAIYCGGAGAVYFAGAVTANSTLNVTGKVSTLADLQIGSGYGYYIGDSATNGSWRIMPSGANLLIQKREAGSWVTKDTIFA
ncbi:MAG: hypothetical protein K8L91_01575 [Anaerolineae bacterium]|nr:hypothetical protein [Anaerolineae bacterium]